MATKKITTTKKKTTAVKKAPVKKPAPRGASVSKKATQDKRESFVRKAESQKFLTFTPSIQTLYWVVIGVLCIIFTAWIMKLQSDINAIYDSIDQTSTQIVDIPHHTKK